MKTVAEMSYEERAELINAFFDETKEVWYRYGLSTSAVRVERSPKAVGFTELDSYEVRTEVIPDTVPKELISDEYQWYARDEDGRAFTYQHLPLQESDAWWPPSDDIEGGHIVNHLKAFKQGTVDWKDSLQKRPEGM